MMRERKKYFSNNNGSLVCTLLPVKQCLQALSLVLKIIRASTEAKSK